MTKRDMAKRHEIEYELRQAKNYSYRPGDWHDIYEREMMEELFEDDELSAEEEGFMAGYLEA